jgi:hypothetical protein
MHNIKSRYLITVLLLTNLCFANGPTIRNTTTDCAVAVTLTDGNGADIITDKNQTNPLDTSYTLYPYGSRKGPNIWVLHEETIATNSEVRVTFKPEASCSGANLDIASVRIKYNVHYYVDYYYDTKDKEYKARYSYDA